MWSKTASCYNGDGIGLWSMTASCYNGDGIGLCQRLLHAIMVMA